MIHQIVEWCYSATSTSPTVGNSLEFLITSGGVDNKFGIIYRVWSKKPGKPPDLWIFLVKWPYAFVNTLCCRTQLDRDRMHRNIYRLAIDTSPVVLSPSRYRQLGSRLSEDRQARRKVGHFGVQQAHARACEPLHKPRRPLLPRRGRICFQLRSAKYISTAWRWPAQTFNKMVRREKYSERKTGLTGKISPFGYPAEYHEHAASRARHRNVHL